MLGLSHVRGVLRVVYERTVGETWLCGEGMGCRECACVDEVCGSWVAMSRLLLGELTIGLEIPSENSCLAC